MLKRLTYRLDGEPGAVGGGTPPDLMGYKSVEDLVAAKRASDAEYKNLAATNKALEQRLGQVESFIAANQRQEIHHRSRPEDRLSEVGIPVDALDEIVNSRVQAGLAAGFQPITQMIQGRTEMLGQYPDYSKFEADVAQFIGGDANLNQRYQRMFQTDPAGAMEFAFLKFGEHQRRTAKPEDQTKGRRVDATIPSNRTGDSRGVGTDRYEEAKRAAKEHFNKTGDARPLAKTVYGNIIRDEFLNQ